MRTARITSRQASEALFPLVDEDISTVVREEEMAAEVAEIDALIEEVDRELAAEADAAAHRALRPFTDVERARRSQRRTVRDALRSLPVRIEAADVAGEVAA